MTYSYTTLWDVTIGSRVPEDLSQVGGIHVLREFIDDIFLHIGRVEAGTIIARIPRRKMHVKFTPSFSIAFGEAGILDDDNISVMQVLGGFGGHVSNLLDDYEDRFVRPFYASKG